MAKSPQEKIKDLIWEEAELFVDDYYIPPDRFEYFAERIAIEVCAEFNLGEG